MREEVKVVVDPFLLKVRAVLPDFVLHNEQRTEEILTRIQSDILRRADVLRGGDELTGTHVQAVIDRIPSVQKYADSFLERGKPRFYITEELAPTYFRTLLLAGLGIFLLTLIPQLMKIGQESGGKIIGYVFSGLFTSAVSVFSFVTVAFVGMSKLGIFPEDFARFRRKAKEHAEEHASSVRVHMEKDFEEFRRTRDEIKSEREKKRRRSRAGEVVGAIFGILFGFFLIVQLPFGILNQSNPLFLSWLRIFGGIIVFRNLWKAIQALIPFERIWARRIIYALGELLGLLHIPLFFWLRDHISVVPAFSTSPRGLLVHEPSLRATEILFWVFTALIVLTVLGAVIGFIKSLAMKRNP